MNSYTEPPYCWVLLLYTESTVELYLSLFRRKASDGGQQWPPLLRVGLAKYRQLFERHLIAE